MSNWLPVEATLLEWQRLGRKLKELQVSVEVDQASGEQLGEALWGVIFRGALVGLGWRWREISPNLVAIDNPLNISSNVVLLDEQGAEVPTDKRILQLNNAINRLDWFLPVVARTRRRHHALAA
jgi:hypothetical protein